MKVKENYMTLVHEPTMEHPVVGNQYYEADQEGQTGYLFDQAVEIPVTRTSYEPNQRPSEQQFYGRGRIPEDTGHQVSYMAEESQKVRYSHSHSHSTEKRWSRLKSFGVGGVVGALAVGALFYWPAATNDTEFGTKGKVVSVVPAELDQRATVTAYVRAGVHRNAGGWKGAVLRFSHLASTFQMTSTFTGPNGKGGGEIDTEVKVGTLGAHQETSADGHITEVIPSSDIVLTSVVNEAASQVVEDNGDGWTIGAAELHLSPFGVKNDVANNQADLNQVAVAEAVNYMQESCDQAAWPLTLKAITKAYENIASYDAKTERAAGANIRPFDPKKFSVVITGGTPSFPPAYTFSHNAGYSFTRGPVSKCTIAKGALKLGPKTS